MALNIKDSTTERVVRRLASLTGEGITDTVRIAAEERLLRLERPASARSLADDLVAIGARCAALPDLTTATPEEILGYDDIGLPR